MLVELLTEKPFFSKSSGFFRGERLLLELLMLVLQEEVPLLLPEVLMALALARGMQAS